MPPLYGVISQNARGGAEAARNVQQCNIQNLMFIKWFRKEYSFCAKLSSVPCSDLVESSSISNFKLYITFRTITELETRKNISNAVNIWVRNVPTHVL